MKSASKDGVQHLADWVRSKPRTRQLLEQWKPGEQIHGADIQQAEGIARTCFYKGLVRPVKASEAWIPCVLTEVGVAVMERLKGMQ